MRIVIDRQKPTLGIRHRREIIFDVVGLLELFRRPNPVIFGLCEAILARYPWITRIALVARGRRYGGEESFGAGDAGGT